MYNTGACFEFRRSLSPLGSIGYHVGFLLIGGILAIRHIIHLPYSDLPVQPVPNAALILIGEPECARPLPTPWPHSLALCFYDQDLSTHPAVLTRFHNRQLCMEYDAQAIRDFLDDTNDLGITTLYLTGVDTPTDGHLAAIARWASDTYGAIWETPVDHVNPWVATLLAQTAPRFRLATALALA